MMPDLRRVVAELRTDTNTSIPPPDDQPERDLAVPTGSGPEEGRGATVETSTMEA